MIRFAPALVALALPGVALAQSAEDDSELFPEDEQQLRLGDDERAITIAPFVQLDAGYSALDPGDDGFEAETRLARLYAFVDYDAFGGTVAYDFQNDTLRYAFATWQAGDRLTLQLGQQDEPFSLQDYSGSRFLPFAEGGQSAALIPGDNLGAVLRYGGEDFSLAGGVFGGNANNGFFENGIAATARATWAPVYSQSPIDRGGDATRSGTGTQRVDDLLHLGIALSARFDIDEKTGFAGGASSSLIGRPIADVRPFPKVDRLLRANLEASRVIGPLSIQGEWTLADVDAPGRSATGHGGYLYVTCFLTGERRGYSRSSGTFGRVVPIAPVDDGGFGAFELGVRIDYLDLTDLGPGGGAQVGLSAVANLYLTKRITLTADYSRTEATAGPEDGLEAHALTARLQFAY